MRTRNVCDLAGGPTATPWSLRDPHAVFRLRDAPEIDATVIEMRRMVGKPTEDIGAFIAQAQETLRRGRGHVVLDLRANSGSDLTTIRDFMRALRQLASGRVFVLTSPRTFSAAITGIGYLKLAAPIAS